MADTATKNSSCTFCKIYESRTGVILETKFFFAQFDRFPASPGHSEVIPKRHIESVLSLEDEEWSDLYGAIRSAISVIEKTDFRALYSGFADSPLSGRSEEFCRLMLKHVGLGKRPDGYNYGINDGRAAGRTIDHLHLHIIPRYFGDVQDPTGGVRHMLPGMGNYKKE
ncbi:MAG: HIT family protein [Candidatus Micrarchaeaceae archaeon]